MTLRAALREAVRQEHELLDGAMALTGPGLSQASLVRALQHLLALALTAESHAGGAWGEVLPRSAWLRTDLERLGGDTTVPPLGISGEPPVGVAALGWAYVLEGSALGAQVITRGLREALPQLPEPHYFSQVAAAGRGRWPAFLEILGAVPETSHESVIAAAKQLFVALAERVESSRP